MGSMARSLASLEPFARAACTLLVLLSVSCTEAGEPDDDVGNEAGSDGGDAGRDASGPDADIDASSDASIRLDASADANIDANAPPIDAASDAAADARVCTTVSLSCAPRRAPVVRCGTGTCSGATPICCSTKYNTFGAPHCADSVDDCWVDGGAVENSAIIIDRCDDTADCAEGQFCRDAFNKGLTRRNGGECTNICREDLSSSMYQRCSSDCECPSGVQCTNGCCGACLFE